MISLSSFSISRFVLCGALVAGCMVGGQQHTAGSLHASCELKSFRVTAYYSPLEDQQYYVQGSLEADKILNGNGTHGASGAPVFNGMVAAPRSYGFGTRVYIPGRGIGQIEDRGGAIVQAGERDEVFDRLDIWAGKGQPGLDAAMRFGVRYVDAYICPKGVGGDAVGFDFSRIPLSRTPLHTAASLQQKEITSLWEMSLQPGSVSRRTPILQRYLKKMGYMRDVPESTHFGPETTRAVCHFQQAHLGWTADNMYCGWFGAQTRFVMQDRVKQFAANRPLVPDTSLRASHQETKQVAQEQENISSVASTVSSSSPISPERFFVAGGEFAGYSIGPLKPGDEGQEVRILQRKLQWLGYYPKEIDISGRYDLSTIRAVYGFQLANGLLRPDTDASVFGYLGPKTRAKLNSV